MRNEIGGDDKLDFDDMRSPDVLIPREAHNYEIEIRRMIEEGSLSPACVNSVQVLHDPWCASRNVVGERCNCEPVIIRQAEVRIEAHKVKKGE